MNPVALSSVAAQQQAFNPLQAGGKQPDAGSRSGQAIQSQNRPAAQSETLPVPARPEQAQGADRLESGTQGVSVADRVEDVRRSPEARERRSTPAARESGPEPQVVREQNAARAARNEGTPQPDVERKPEPPPKPVVNAFGQKTGSIINTTA